MAKIKNTALAQKFSDDFNIDAGEAEAPALAIEKKSPIVATDDRNAIRACKILKLDFITAVAVLIRAVEKGLIEKDEGQQGNHRRCRTADTGRSLTWQQNLEHTRQ